MPNGGKRESPENTNRPAASSGTIPTYENLGVTQPGIKPDSPWWQASKQQRTSGQRVACTPVRKSSCKESLRCKEAKCFKSPCSSRFTKPFRKESVLSSATILATIDSELQCQTVSPDFVIIGFSGLPPTMVANLKTYSNGGVPPAICLVVGERTGGDQRVLVSLLRAAGKGIDAWERERLVGRPVCQQRPRFGRVIKLRSIATRAPSATVRRRYLCPAAELLGSSSSSSSGVVFTPISPRSLLFSTPSYYFSPGRHLGSIAGARTLEYFEWLVVLFLVSTAGIRVGYACKLTCLNFPRAGQAEIRGHTKIKFKLSLSRAGARLGKATLPGLYGDDTPSVLIKACTALHTDPREGPAGIHLPVTRSLHLMLPAWVCRRGGCGEGGGPGGKGEGRRTTSRSSEQTRRAVSRVWEWTSRAASQVAAQSNLATARTTIANARSHQRGSKLDRRSDLRSTQKTLAPFEFRAELEIEIKFISNRRNWRFEISIRDQQPSSTKSCSPPTKATRVQSLAGSLPDFRMWESSRAMALVGGFSQGSPIPTAIAFRRYSILTSLHPHWLSRPR
ncbi:hypothetical protein PR048_001170 [Dryococelus australis]|uniref:Uncharacterized protein n=1 Tax=Dryococelus australis TaxID=614101 RepID=A0ABQ9IGQ4_9NEOP|nr:hypothetical protein PR048_001170 [Dryococelus australis]